MYYSSILNASTNKLNYNVESLVLTFYQGAIFWILEKSTF